MVKSRRNGVKIGYMPQYLPIDRNMPLTARRFLDLAGRFGAAARSRVLEETGILVSGRQYPRYIARRVATPFIGPRTA